MDYKDFTKRKDAYDGFLKLRKTILDSSENSRTFNDVFSEICTRAYMGDCVAQDCVAYFFNRGVPNMLMENYDYYLGWEILAGANGNEFALEKLEFFLNSALEEIIDDEELLATAMQRGNINKNNALMVISNLLCEGIADQIKLEPKNLIDFKNTPVPYSPEITRVYQDALDKCLIPVAQYLVS